MENMNRSEPPRFPQLDGLRGIAVLIVIFGHLAMYDFGLGLEAGAPLAPTGVDLFFVLSGFLITGGLWRSRGGARYYMNFYARRALRIWPLYGLFILFLFAVADRWIPALRLPPGVHWPVFVLFVQNFWYGQSGEMGLALGITWSLAIEEQFYLAWPIGVAKLSAGGARAVLVCAIGIAPIARWFLAPRDYMNPLCRFDAIAMGSLLALWIATRNPGRRQLRDAALLMIALAVCGEAIVLATGTRHLLHVTMVSAIFTGILALSLESDILVSALSIRALRYTGKVSYCLYLCHMIVSLLVLSLLPGTTWSVRLGRVLLILAASYGVASLSWYLLEKRFLKLKRYFDSKAPAPRNTPTADVLVTATDT
jgi:peptidoglycan/LPS O-acetylase OafA/YrhL